MIPPATLDLLVRLGLPEDRVDSADALARALGVSRFLVFVVDPIVHSLLPAPGFKQTLHGGPAWRAFLKSATKAGRHFGNVDLPVGNPQPAVALAGDDVSVVLIGGQPADADLDGVERVLPLLGAMFRAEYRAATATAEASEAERVVRRAHALAAALDAARGEQAKLNVELQEEHRRKDEFLAMLAHELRNPLAPMVNSLQLLRQHQPPVDGGLIEIINRQLSQLSRLIDDLLDVSRVQHGRIEVRRAILRLEDVLRGALAGSRPVLDARNVAVEVDFPDGSLRVDGDDVRLTQVFSNLLHNAAKYTDPGGKVTIAASRDGNEVVIKVTDTGIGISAETLPRVFDLFTQAPVSLGRAQGGLGIGLTLVRAIVELHGGQVTAASPGIAAGSTFTVRLPLASESSASQPPATVRSVEPPAKRALHVLVVDDVVDNANSLAMLLRLMGHETHVSFGALNALHLAEDLDPDLILLDIGLPELDGYQVARRLRRMLRRDTRIVALTGYGSEADRQRALEAGFDEHLVKPVSHDQLEAVMARAAAPA